MVNNGCFKSLLFFENILQCLLMYSKEYMVDLGISIYWQLAMVCFFSDFSTQILKLSFGFFISSHTVQLHYYISELYTDGIMVRLHK